MLTLVNVLANRDCIRERMLYAPVLRVLLKRGFRIYHIDKLVIFFSLLFYLSLISLLFFIFAILYQILCFFNRIDFIKKLTILYFLIIVKNNEQSLFRVFMRYH